MGAGPWLLCEACVPSTHPCKICRSSGSCDGCCKVSSEAQSTKLLSSVRSELRSVKVAALTSWIDALRLLLLLADLTAKRGAQTVLQTGDWPATTRVRVCMQTLSGETQSYHLPLSTGNRQILHKHSLLVTPQANTNDRSLLQRQLP